MNGTTAFLAVLAVLVGMALAVVFSAILALPVEWLWNGTLVDVFPSVHSIDFMHAWGLSLLCSFLFKSYTTSTSK